MRNPKTKRHALGIYVTKKGAQGALSEIRRKFKSQFKSFRVYQDRWKQWVVDAEVKTKKNPPRKSARNPKALKVGDSVKYSRGWLRSVGIFSGSLPFARGPITAMTPLGSITLATIDWGDPEIPERVNVKNLAAAKAREVENPKGRRKAKHNPVACNNPRHAHRNPGLAGIMDKRSAAKARRFA